MNRFAGPITKGESNVKEWNEFKETVSVLIHTVIALLLFPTVIFVIAMWIKVLVSAYEVIWS